MNIPNVIFVTLPSASSGVFWQDPNWLAACTGILALFVSLVISIFGIKQQNKITAKQIKSALREQWLHDFRNDVALFVSYTSQLNDAISNEAAIKEYIYQLENEINKPVDLIAELKAKRNHISLRIQELRTESLTASYKIKIFLTPTHPSHDEMVSLITEWKELHNNWKDAISQKQEAKKADLIKQGLELQKKIPLAAQKIILEETASLSS